MSRFIIDQSFWDLFPDASIGVLLLKEKISRRRLIGMGIMIAGIVIFSM